MENQQDQINVVDTVKVIVQGKKIIIWSIVITIVIALGAFFYSVQNEKITYQANAIFEVGQIYKGPVGSLVRPEGLLEDVTELVGKINYGFFGKSVTAVNIPSTSLIELKSQSSDKQAAVTAVSSTLGAVMQEQQKLWNTYQQSLAQKTATVQAAQNKFLAIGQQSALFQLRLFDLQDTLDDAKPSAVVKNPEVVVSQAMNKNLRLIFLVLTGAILGFFVGVGVVFFREWWHKNSKSFA